MLAIALSALALALPLLAQDPLVALKYAAFDPATTRVQVPAELRGGEDTELWIVQFETAPTDRMRAAVRDEGGEIHGYLPENAYVTRMPIGAAAAVRLQRDVRSVTYYHPAFRLEGLLRLELKAGTAPKRRYNLVVVDELRDKPGLAQRLEAVGGRVEDDGGGSLLMSATLDAAQLLQTARFDQVLWIDRWSAPEDDMSNARVQGGGNYVESAGGYTGQGIVGHQMEGLNPSHVDWNLTPIGYPAGCAVVSPHGHNTAGIVYGNGTSISIARGMAPDAQCVFTSCRDNRWNNLQALIANYRIMFTTASWGSALTRDYTSVSAEADDICFDHDLVWTNSQSNDGTQNSRGEAWSKNVFAIGGVRHNDNSNPLDDSWQAGNASRGPAADGRSKPDFCAYYDNIATSSSGGSYTLTFGGTSGATPIVAGHNAIAIQMFTDGVFGNPLRVPGGTRFQNKPHFATLKALQMVNAEPYAFTAASTDNRREHQGYGFPNLRNMWDDRNVTFIVDEEDLLQQGDAMAYTLAVSPGRSLLKISMSYADVAGNPAAAIARVNDLTLRVTSPTGTVYWGNEGLTAGNWSTTGGSRDRINTAENVFVSSPAPGNWTVEVIAYVVAEDTHVETPAVDADFGLVVRGGTLVAKAPGSVPVGSVTAFGQGCTGSVVLPPVCASWNANGGALTQETRSYEYAYEATASAALVVTGFELWTATTGGGTVNAPAAIYLSAGSGPSATPLATTAMTVGGTEGFYGATFAAPVAIPAGATFYVSLTHNNDTYISTLTSGATRPGYYRTASGWSRSTVATEPSFRVLCTGSAGNAVPRFELGGIPEIGGQLSAALDLAAPNAPAALLVGTSDSSWLGLGLPADLGAIGAPGCWLLVSGQGQLAFTTDGDGAVRATLGIPTAAGLVGYQAFLQFLIADPGANALGVVATGAQALTVGS